jgi:hypothetical protein
MKKVLYIHQVVPTQTVIIRKLHIKNNICSEGNVFSYQNTCDDICIKFCYQTTRSKCIKVRLKQSMCVDERHRLYICIHAYMHRVWKSMILLSGWICVGLVSGRDQTHVLSITPDTYITLITGPVSNTAVTHHYGLSFTLCIYVLNTYLRAFVCARVSTYGSICIIRWG